MKSREEISVVDGAAKGGNFYDSRQFFQIEYLRPGVTEEEIDLISAAEAILNFALASVDPAILIDNSLRRKGNKLEILARNKKAVIDLESFHRVFVVAIGKAAPLMAGAFLKILEDRVNRGIVVCLPGVEFFWPGLEKLEAPHPLPDERSLQVAQRIIELSQEIDENDLVFFLISGGASAQVAMPVKPVTLAQKARLTRILMEAGADIRELNVVRKHLSEVKGGRLSRLFSRCTLVNLIISDVIGDDLETIASGLTTWDSSTYFEAKEILRKYKIWDNAPDSIKEVIERGLRGEIKETRKKDEIEHEKVLNFIIGNIEVAISASIQRAREMGFKPIVLSQRETGEARERARQWAGLVRSLALSAAAALRPLGFISGGELTVTVKGKGQGGRNLEFCLAFLKEMIEHPLPEPFIWCAASLATDGCDGSAQAAGALISPFVIEKVAEAGLDPAVYLDNNDSLNFFKKIGGLIITGPTGTNVMDLRLLLVKNRNEPERK